SSATQMTRMSRSTRSEIRGFQPRARCTEPRSDERPRRRGYEGRVPDPAGTRGTSSPSFRQGRGVEGKRDVSRIRIEDLPPETDLPPEELEQTSGGAGRSVRPEVEGLEERQLLAANPAGTLMHQPVGDAGHVGPTVQQTPEMQVLHAPG